MTNTTNEIDDVRSRYASISRLALNEACELLTELECHADDEQQKRIDKLFDIVMDGKGYWFPEDYDERFWKKRNNN
jgi:hypothetical protein